MAKRIKKTPHMMKIWKYETPEETFVSQDYFLYDDGKSGVKGKEDFIDLKLHIDELVLLPTNNIRHTRNTSYSRFTVVKMPASVKAGDNSTCRQVDVTQDGYTYKQCAYGAKPAILTLEVPSDEVAKLFKYYNCKKKQIIIPMDKFRINNRPEMPNVQFI